jgi:hypothetical protein
VSLRTRFLDRYVGGWTRRGSSRTAAVPCPESELALFIPEIHAQPVLRSVNRRHTLLRTPIPGTLESNVLAGRLVKTG